MAVTTDSFSTGDAVRITGVSFRNIDYWARTRFIVPSIAEAKGTGTERKYSFSDLLALRVARELREGRCVNPIAPPSRGLSANPKGFDESARAVPPDRNRHRCSGGD
jgi:DNA-binding transcriptional MerR regulator